MPNVEYPLIEWKQQSFLEHVKIIISNTHYCIHKIELDNGENVYIVPEAFYKAAVLAFKKQGGKK